MSTATADLYPVTGTVAPLAVSRRGGHLRLVATDERHPVASPVRLTRRGRLTLTATAALVLLLAFTSLLNAVGPAGASLAVTVEPGMTLSQIAAEHLPEVPLGQAVVDLQRVNKLSTTSVAAGQELVIPSR